MKFLMLILGTWLLSLSVVQNTRAAQSDYKYNNTHRPGGADLIAACNGNPNRDLTCRSIVELNDFSLRFINHLIQQSGLRKYEKWLGPVLGVLVNEKLTLSYALPSYKFDVTYNTRSEVISCNVIKEF